jgi:hypothetical protein
MWTHTQVIEVITLVDSTAPDPDHVLIPPDEQLEPTPIPFLRRVRQERIDGYPVGSSSKDGDVVDFEVERRAFLVEESVLDDA